MKLSCDIIRDLLPLYAEDLASPDSRGAVREHLQGCESCRAELETMKQPVPVPEVKPGMRKIKKEIVRRWLLGVACGMLSILLLASCAGWWLLNPIYLPETVVASVEPSEHLDGWVQIYASAPPEGYRWLSCDGREWTEDIQYVAFYTCRIVELMQEKPFEEYVSVRPGDGPIWLFLESGDMKLLHGTADDTKPPVQWSMLEKLSLYAVAAGGVLLVLGMILRVKRAGRWAIAVGSLGICYAVCQWAVCGGSMMSFFWKRELLWAVLISGSVWGIGMCICGLGRKR